MEEPEVTIKEPEAVTEPNLEDETVKLEEKVNAAEAEKNRLIELAEKKVELEAKLAQIDKDNLISEMVSNGQMAQNFANAWGSEQDLETLQKYKEANPVLPQNKIPDDGDAGPADQEKKGTQGSVPRKDGTILGMRPSSALLHRYSDGYIINGAKK